MCSITTLQSLFDLLPTTDTNYLLQTDIDNHILFVVGKYNPNGNEYYAITTRGLIIKLEYIPQPDMLDNKYIYYYCKNNKHDAYYGSKDTGVYSINQWSHASFKCCYCITCVNEEEAARKLIDPIILHKLIKNFSIYVADYDTIIKYMHKLIK